LEILGIETWTVAPLLSFQIKQGIFEDQTYLISPEIKKFTLLGLLYISLLYFSLFIKEETSQSNKNFRQILEKITEENQKVENELGMEIVACLLL